MIGKQITWTDTEGKEQSGQVSAVKVLNGKTYLMVGDKQVALEQVTKVQPQPTKEG